MSKLEVLIKDAEIRGVEEKEGRQDAEGKKGASFLIVKIDDEAGNRHELIDRDVENRMKYKRGQFCDIVAVVNYNNFGGGGKTWCRFEIKSINERK